ncbi:hypothetical protein LZD49_35025 [Dyadobacter sp. CY261]|uniref:hypothetical protein n=1 Tax=Dyadobacter sp. CY261 TaxID=2907203 RepID=UPI001F2C0367|nr:hypothetical protein [Dyadobacter sp. CY261]MCF0075737.1 hypothetical protein [Dyadobacter sp. CY261]
MATLLSLLALFATFYQLYLQRTHNEKSLKPLPQIVLGDHGQDIFVHIRNNGVGPLIVESLTFTRNGKAYSGIEECLDLPPRSYMHVRVTSTAKKLFSRVQAWKSLRRGLMLRKMKYKWMTCASSSQNWL